ncbi:MAG TPA: 2-C-methyl-D-erythritol 2,4-cyclodiphosphate synthase [Bacteroidales bacterium]|nr:2-C-methyl-D-erythritol 2,4-cyclodiphosphate synthase [Bacteroidales bacterium]HRZ22138.1 2-C-methyl-D-erythritol 2,4-cyclodiphosphate synthase [Bacteroidales bacterium]
MKSSPNDHRTGLGYDIHRLIPDRPLFLGGLQIHHSKGCLGHSDGDVLIHAICDALLGAAGLRDIGFYFPDTSPEFKGIDSKILLRKVMQLVHEKGFHPVNIDTTIVLEQPRLASYIPEMKKILAEILETSEETIAIKAKTNEGLGPIGHEDAIASYAIVLLHTSRPASV